MSVSLYQIYVLCDLQRLPQAGKGTFARKMGGKGGGEVRKVANLQFQRCVSLRCVTLYPIPVVLWCLDMPWHALQGLQKKPQGAKCTFTSPKWGQTWRRLHTLHTSVKEASVGVPELEITAFGPLFDPLYGWIGTPPVISTFLPIFWATCWYLTHWGNIEGEGWRSEKPEKPGIWRFPQYL